MTQRQFQFIFMFILFLYSCSNNNSLSNKKLDVPSSKDIIDSINYSNRKKHFGVSLINGKTGGMAFTDSTGATKFFRSIKFQIVNDTVIPISLQIYFSNKPYDFFHTRDVKFKAFLLPDSVSGFGSELNAFLNKSIQKPSDLKRAIQPGETYTVNIGILFFCALGMPDGFTSEEVFFKDQSHDLNRPDKIISLKNIGTKDLDIILGVTLHSRSTYYSNISCGQILFTK